MLDLISYLIREVPLMLVSEYFIPAVGITVIVGSVELVFMLLNIRHKNRGANL